MGEDFKNYLSWNKKFLKMKVAIMQPYFLRFIGYWQLINAVDKFVILDDN